MGGRGGSSGKGGGGGLSVERSIQRAKSKGVFDVEWFSSLVENPALSVAIRNITATPDDMERIVSKNLKPGESVQDAVKVLQDSHIAFNIEVPKYRGTENQVRYAQNLAEAYVISVSNTIASRWSNYSSRGKIKQALEKQNIKFTGNNYAKYMIESSKTLKAVQSLTNASDVITLLKGKANPNQRAYNEAPQGYAMRKTTKF